MIKPDKMETVETVDDMKNHFTMIFLESIRADNRGQTAVLAMTLEVLAETADLDPDERMDKVASHLREKFELKATGDDVGQNFYVHLIQSLMPLIRWKVIAIIMSKVVIDELSKREAGNKGGPDSEGFSA